jgi:hypothetical protein
MSVWRFGLPVAVIIDEHSLSLKRIEKSKEISLGVRTMMQRMFFYVWVVVFLFSPHIFHPGLAQAGGLIPCQGDKANQAFVLTEQAWIVTPGDPPVQDFQKTTLSFDCHYDWSEFALIMSCKNRANDTFSAIYEFVYIYTDKPNSRTDKIMVYLWGGFNLTVMGYPRDGFSSGFLSGTEKKDSSGNITSISLTGNLYGGIDGDSVFQGSVKVTMTPK